MSLNVKPCSQQEEFNSFHLDTATGEKNEALLLWHCSDEVLNDDVKTRRIPALKAFEALGLVGIHELLFTALLWSCVRRKRLRS